jgi:S1-C subfamily serine protease
LLCDLGGRVSCCDRPVKLEIFIGLTLADLSDGRGAFVKTMSPGGRAARAGVRAGDVILAIQEATVNSAAAVGCALYRLQPGNRFYASAELIRSIGIGLRGVVTLLTL